MTLRIAILGAGRIGKVHAKAVDADRDAKLVAIADAVPAAAEALAAPYGAQIRTIDEIEAAEDVDAVLICTPTNTHADLIERFARAGKAIFCEKPVDLDLDRVRRCLAVVEETGAKLMIGFNRRFDPHFRAVREAIRAGRIGAVEQVLITSRDPGLAPVEYLRVSGGIFRDMTIHDFDMARWLLDEEIETVWATGSVLVDPKVAELGDFDTASVVMTTASGRQAVITNSRRATYGYDQRIEVHGSAGAVSAENDRPVRIELANAEGYTRPPLHDFFMTRYLDAYASEIAAFVAAVRGEAEITPTGRDGFLALALAEAAARSAASASAVRLADVG